MTGVVRTHRRRGIAVALKLMVIRRARELGVPAIRTFHHPSNEAAIAVNRLLGYVDVGAPPPTVSGVRGDARRLRAGRSTDHR
jgi:RimJ/RimL family protein N-acetyltransferase